MLNMITFGQNVGIGTANPATRLHVSGTSANIATFNGGNGMWMTIAENGVDRGYIGSFSGNAEDVDFGTYNSNATGKVHLTTGNQPRLSVNSSGNVGIGTPSPESRLHVRTDNWIKTIYENDAGQPRGYIGTDNNGTLTLSSNAYWNGSAWVYPNTGNNSLYLLLHQPNQAFEFRVRPDGGSQSTAMVVKVNGNVGIGTNNPAAKLDINGDVNIQNRVLLNNAAGNAGQALISNGNASNPTWQDIAYSNNDRFMFTTASAIYTTGFNNLQFNTIYSYSSAISYSNGVFTVNKSGLYSFNGHFTSLIEQATSNTEPPNINLIFKTNPPSAPQQRFYIYDPINPNYLYNSPTNTNFFEKSVPISFNYYLPAGSQFVLEYSVASAGAISSIIVHSLPLEIHLINE
jgi:hypothetical protein